MKDKMKKLVGILLIALGAFGGSCQKDKMMGDPVDTIKQVTKTNPMKIYMHYMPWFNSKEFSGYWGTHWRMSNKNPETILPNSQREIASHYYPLIGPYDSSDPDLVDYHALLMKYIGVDGILIDWYGSYNVLDYGANLKNSNAIIEGMKKVGLGFGIVYEDATAGEVSRRKGITTVAAAQEDMKYMQQNYFTSDRYLQLADKPLVLTFGPRTIKTPDEWSQVLNVLNPKPSFLPLWDHTYRVGNENATGEFSWVDFNSSLEDLDHFYSTTSPETHIGSAYAGYNDFYVQGGWGTSNGFVEHGHGEILDLALQKAQSHNLNYLQLVTWNDFGEGTMLEPTVEYQYQFLERLQQFTGVSYDKSDLEVIYTYYLKRKQYKGNADVELVLDNVFKALNDLDIATAKDLIHNL